jgi:dCMP deaminase
MRPSFQSIYMNLAKQLAKRSHHPRVKVGCVITSTDHEDILAIGYNGNERNGSNKLINSKPGHSEMIHAEQNSLIKINGRLKYEPKYVYVTTAPCIICAKGLVNLGGVDTVYYKTNYRNKKGIKLLEHHMIKCIQL